MGAQPKPSYDHLFQLLLIGDSGVGKTCLLLRYADDSYSEAHSATIGVDFKVRSLDVGSTRVRLQLWDTAGQERFRTITSSYYRRAHGIVVVFDLTDRRSFEHVRPWLHEIEKYAAGCLFRLIVGNKADLASQRVVTQEEAAGLAESMGISYKETSARDASNVEGVFTALVEQLLAGRAQEEEPKDRVVLGGDGVDIDALGPCAC